MHNRHEEPISISMKTVFLGKTQAGKTWLISKLCKNTSADKYKNPFADKYRKTIDCDFARRTLSSTTTTFSSSGDDISVELQIWDMAGDHCFTQTLLSHALNRDTQLAFVCCAKSDTGPLNYINQCITDIQNMSPDASIFIILTKSDLPPKANLLPQIMKIVKATEHCAYLGEISAKTSPQNEIDALFQCAIAQRLELEHTLRFKNFQEPQIQQTSLEKFHAAHKKICEGTWFKLFGHTNVDPEAKSLIAIFENMGQHKSKRTKGIFKAFGWMDKKGNLDLEKAPEDVIEAYEQVVASKSRKSSLL